MLRFQPSVDIRQGLRKKFHVTIDLSPKAVMPRDLNLRPQVENHLGHKISGVGLPKYPGAPEKEQRYQSIRYTTLSVWAHG